MARAPNDLIYSRFQQARARTREIEGRELSPKEFLDLIDPTGRRSESSAARYMRKLRSGERSGATLKKRAEKDSGRMVNVRYRVGTYRDSSGQEFADVRSANIILPTSKSRLDLWQGDRLWKAVNRYLRKSYSRRTEANEKAVYEPIRSLPPGSQLESIVKVTRARYPAEVLR